MGDAMDTLTALGIVGGLLALSLAIGFAWKAGQGAVEQRNDKGAIPERLRARGASLTLLQVSSEMCSYCAAMRRILSQIDREKSDVGHVEIDAANEPELVSSLRITQTPTTLLVARSGDIVSWIRGAATPAAVTQAIAEAQDRLRKGSHDWSI
jgi:thioredoxin-related protein